MAKELIRLKNGTLVEIDILGDQVEQISGGMATKVEKTFDQIKPILFGVCKPLTDVWTEVNKDLQIEQAEIELGLSFEGEGNLYITKSKAGANLNIKLVLKPKGTNS